MVEKLDLKDRKLLYMLLENSKLPLGEIAKYVGLSKNAVFYRINRLKEKGIIWKFFAAVDYAKIGVYTCHVFIKLKATEQREREIKEYFRSHPNVVWAATIFGKWDLFVQFLVKEPKEFEIVLDGVITYLGDNLDSYDAQILVERLKLYHQLYDLKMNYRYRRKPAAYSKVFKLDELDRKILNCLNSTDALANYQAIGKYVGASMETARNRVNKLAKEGVIERFFPFVVHTKLGLTRHLIRMNFRHFTKKLEKEIVNYLINASGVNLGFKVIGRPEIYFWYVTDSPVKVEALVKEIKHRFYEVIVDMEPMVTTEELTLNFFPKGLMV